MKLMTLLVMAVSGIWCQAGSSSLTGPANESLPEVTKVVAGERSVVIAPVLQAAARQVRMGNHKKNITSPIMRVNAQGEVQVLIRWGANAKDTVRGLAKEGFRAEVVSKTVKMAQGWLPLASLEVAALVPGVASIDLPGYARTRAGSVMTEGDAATQADLVRSQLGYDGTGIKIGVISDGLDGLAGSQASGDLPGQVDIDPDLPGGGAEGTAMLEIIHDVAPGAELAFSGPRTKLEFLAALDYLVQIAQCDVVVDDLGFYDEPYFQDGIVAEAVAVAANQVVYVSAAGNDGYHHYQGMYADSNPGETGWVKDLHDFGGGDNVMPVTILPGTDIAVFLQWADPFGSASNDYDLFLYNDDLSEALTWSNATQDGDDDPYEALTYANVSPEPITAYVVINRASGGPRMLEMYTWDTASQAFSTASNAIFGHPAAQGVLSVGMTRWDSEDRDTLALDSSQGLSSMFSPTQADRPTPRLVGWDGISVSDGMGGSRTCYGTSAAAAQVAGVAALVMEAMPSLTSPAQVRQWLEDAAQDLGVPGYDSIYGAGRVMLGRSSSRLVPPGDSVPAMYGETGLLIDLASSSDSGSLTVDRVDFEPPNLENALNRYWYVSGMEGNDYSLNAIFSLKESDFPTAEFQNYDAAIFRSLDGGQTWEEQDNTAYDANNLLVTCPSQRELGLYAVIVFISSKEAVSGVWGLYE